MIRLAWLIPLLPLAGSALLGAVGRRLGERAVGAIAIGAVALSFLLSASVVYDYVSHHRSGHEEGSAAVSVGDSFPASFDWIPGGAARTSGPGDANAPVAGGLSIRWSYAVDSLTCVMLLVVTGVGLLIHIFATGYMKGDGGYARFFSYLNLFMFSMLVLVLAANFPVLFVGWEGVGLCSYLLIGFWYERDAASDAAKKAFVANRIGDAGFLMGIFGAFAVFGSLDFTGIAKALGDGSIAPDALGQWGVLTLIALGLFVGVAGKSAQIPLFVWLPDAMQGPTPVSALIHAATMVTAGIYLMARVSAVFMAAPSAMVVVACVGAATALVAGLSAMAQDDIKKVLAYSTVSQLGLMALSCGAGAFGSAIFHVMTHAFFKALLFLGAGAIIIALHHEQSLRKMGGLARRMPVVCATMCIGALAIAGVPPMSGFFSKDAMLAGVLESTVLPLELRTALFFVGLVVAGLTAFYTTRLIGMAFFVKGDGEGFAYRDTEAQRSENHQKSHDGPLVVSKSMTVPLVLLAVLSVVGGFFDIGHWLGIGAPAAHSGWLVPVLASTTAVSGIALGWWLTVSRPGSGRRIAERLGPFRVAASNAFGFDAFSRIIPIGATLSLARAAMLADAEVVDRAVNSTASGTVNGALGSNWTDGHIVDGVVRGTGDAAFSGSLVFRAVQTGRFAAAALVLALAVALVVLAFGWNALAAVFGHLFGGGQ
jgi:NADH-quinone oxidoreductase subunit L